MEEKSKETLPFVVLNLDKPRKMRFDLNSLIEVQDKYSLCDECFNLIERGEECCGEKRTKKFMVVNNLSVYLGQCMKDAEMLRFLYYIGLKWEDPELTEEKVGELMSLQKIAEISEDVLGHFEGSVVDEEGKKEERATEKEKRKSGAGRSPSKQPVG